jgi:hypothetical protein
MQLAAPLVQLLPPVLSLLPLPLPLPPFFLVPAQASAAEVASPKQMPL